MRNPRITHEDYGRIKGALRRAFARSALHKEALERVTVEHSDPRNPRCTKWGYCEVCGEVQPRWKLVVDHLSPIIPIDKTLWDLSVQELVDNMWCVSNGLQACDPFCHAAKSKRENALRPKRKRKTNVRK